MPMAGWIPTTRSIIGLSGTGCEGAREFYEVLSSIYTFGALQGRRIPTIGPGIDVPDSDHQLLRGSCRSFLTSSLLTIF